VSAGLLLLPFASFLSLLHSVFYPILDIFFPEASPSWLRGSVLPCGGSVGAGWNHLCPTWAAPASPHRSDAAAPHCQHLGACIPYTS